MTHPAPNSELNAVACICLTLGDGPEGCGLCNETGVRLAAPSVERCEDPNISATNAELLEQALSHPPLTAPKPDVAGARARLGYDVGRADDFGNATCRAWTEDLRLILSAYDRQGEEIERLRGALEECQDKLWIARCDSPDAQFRRVAERACSMADDALRARQGGPDHG